MVKKAVVSIKDFFKTVLSVLFLGSHGMVLILVVLLILALVFHDELGAWITGLYERLR